MAEISTIARPYAQAIFSLAKEKETLAIWLDVLTLMTGVIENPDIKSFIQDAKVLDSDREKTLLKIFGKDVDDMAKNFIMLLIENKRLMILPAIKLAYEKLKADYEGTVKAEIIAAAEPDKKAVDNLIKSLEKKFNKKIEGHVTIDKSIIGGTKIIVGDTVIDDSIKGKLENLAYALKA